MRKNSFSIKVQFNTLRGKFSNSDKKYDMIVESILCYYYTLVHATSENFHYTCYTLLRTLIAQ